MTAAIDKKYEDQILASIPLGGYLPGYLCVERACMLCSFCRGKPKRAVVGCQSLVDQRPKGCMTVLAV